MPTTPSGMVTFSDLCRCYWFTLLPCADAGFNVVDSVSLAILQLRHVVRQSHELTQQNMQ